MALSNELIKAFVKSTNDAPQNEKESTFVYATAKKIGDSIYAMFDGSDILTPVKSTIDISDGDRVMILVKNHSGTIVSNYTSPAVNNDSFGTFKNVTAENLKATNALIENVAGDFLDFKKGEFEELKSKTAEIEKISGSLAEYDKVVADKIEVIEADIYTLNVEKASMKYVEVNYATISDMKAINATIINLSGDYSNFKDSVAYNFEATNATIENLDNKYANIDFSNIGKAAIEYFFAQSGLIKDVVVGDGTVTGELVGVTIRGDLIEGNTVVADKLVIKGTDGLYYKLNTDGAITEAEQTDYNSLNGQVIRAKSVTAEKIAVSDLVAFGATIGGFNISNKALYSGVKETVDNTTSGIYMDKYGQLALGDANRFVKYYVDQNGKRRLEISADSFVFGSDNKTLEAAIQEKIDGVEIGGKNLIRNSLNMIFDNYYFESEETIDGNYIIDESDAALLDENDDKLLVC